MVLSVSFLPEEGFYIDVLTMLGTLEINIWWKIQIKWNHIPKPQELVITAQYLKFSEHGKNMDYSKIWVILCLTIQSLFYLCKYFSLYGHNL